MGFFVLLGLSALGISWLAYVALPFWLLAVAFGCYPVLLFVILCSNLDTTRKLSASIERAEADRAALEETLASTITEWDAANIGLAKLTVEARALRDNLERTERALSQERSRGDANGRDLRQRLTRLEAEATQLRGEIAKHAAWRQERQGWRTLPQGHDLEAERFAATVANALR